MAVLFLHIAFSLISDQIQMRDYELHKWGPWCGPLYCLEAKTEVSWIAFKFQTSYFIISQHMSSDIQKCGLRCGPLYCLEAKTES